MCQVSFVVSIYATKNSASSGYKIWDRLLSFCHKTKWSICFLVYTSIKKGYLIKSDYE